MGVDEADDDFSTVEKAGGEKTHKLTIDEMPSHTHGYNASNIRNYVRVEANSTSTYGRDNGVNVQTSKAGGDKEHNNLQPFLTVYFWKRVA